MIVHVGKTVPLIQLPDGSAICFYNRTMEIWTDNIRYATPDGIIKYIAIIDDSYRVNHYRCGCFVRTALHCPIDNTSGNVLLYVPDSVNNEGYGITAYPLFEMITPVISVVNAHNYQLTWWSNVANVKELTKSDDDSYVYEPYSILKFNPPYSGVDALNSSGSVAKILCTGTIEFEDLIQIGGGSVSAFSRPVPILRRIAITAVITGEGLVTDFTNGGNGNGIGIHSHLNNEDGGFAAAVFMPSAIMKPMNWS